MKAVLALENGSLFEGYAVGTAGLSVGEVVFNTAITGYQEILTDPSYARQIVTLTHPHIGNTGVTEEDEEAQKIFASGLVIRDLPQIASSWRKQKTLREYLSERNMVAIAEVDTRKLTRILRDEGSQNGAIIADKNLNTREIEIALQRAKDFEGLKGLDLAKEVTTSEQYAWKEGSWRFGQGHQTSEGGEFNVVAYDFGVKRNILRMLVDRGCQLTVVPAKTKASEILAMQPDGIFLSNGPGDPDPCDYAITAIREFLKTDIPLFGICLGLQLLGLAAGMRTMKMNQGHHGANHPVRNLDNNTVLITSQNHGFCIDESKLPDRIRVTHRSLFDQTIQGIHMLDRPAFGFQGHPEASPGPHDASDLFDHFIDLMRERS